MNIIKSNPNKNWYCNYLSQNPNITFDIIKNNISKISKIGIHELSLNKFSYDPYYVSPFYKKKLVKEFLDTCKEELIKKVCTPR